jgi:hypothetical protein
LILSQVIHCHQSKEEGMPLDVESDCAKIHVKCTFNY